jgi:predicted nucleic acid-binding protein
VIRPTLDSNVLIYALVEPDSAKGRRAIELIAVTAGRGVLATQALGEFLWVVRRRRPDLAVDALQTLGQLREVFAIVDTSVALLAAAAELRARCRLQFWDAVIWQAAASAGANLLLSEDLQDGFRADGMRVLNPFAPANVVELDRLLPR